LPNILITHLKKTPFDVSKPYHNENYEAKRLLIAMRFRSLTLSVARVHNYN